MSSLDDVCQGSIGVNRTVNGVLVAANGCGNERGVVRVVDVVESRGPLGSFFPSFAGE